MSVQCFVLIKNVYKCEVFLLFMNYPCSRLKGIYVNYIVNCYEEVIRRLGSEAFFTNYLHTDIKVEITINTD